MIKWIALTGPEQLASIVNTSHETPCLIFKHSTRCSISSIAKHRLESDWDFSEGHLQAYFLDLIAFRSVSQQVSELFGVPHESPQVLLVRQGECTYDASHLDISVQELKECFEASC